MSLEEVAAALEGLDVDPSVGRQAVPAPRRRPGIELLDEADARERIARLSEEAGSPPPTSTGHETETGTDALQSCFSRPPAACRC